jgi:hypothetical protein
VLGYLGAATHHELIKSVLSFLVSLIVSGAAGPTLDLVRDMSKKGMDPSLMRHFVELVRSTETQHSPSCAHSTADIVLKKQWRIQTSSCVA